MNGTTQATEASSRGQRGLQYPAVSLREAVNRAKVMWDTEKKNTVPYNVLVTHWGYTPKSSSGRGLAAALSRYGLIDSTGGDYKLTNRSLSILLAEGEERAAALREAALSPKVYRDLWERYADSLPSDQSLTHKLVLEGYNAVSIPDLIKDWKDTIEFAGLKKGDTVNSPPAAESYEAPETRGSQGPTAPGGNKPAPPPMNPSLRYLPVPLMIGDAQIPMGMSNEDFELLLQSLQLWKPRLVTHKSSSDADLAPEVS